MAEGCGLSTSLRRNISQSLDRFVGNCVINYLTPSATYDTIQVTQTFIKRSVADGYQVDYAA